MLDSKVESILSLIEIYEDCKKDFERLLSSCYEFKKSDDVEYSLQKFEPMFDKNGFVDCKKIDKTDFRRFILNHISDIREIGYFKNILKRFSENKSFNDYYKGKITNEKEEIIYEPTPKDIFPWVEEFLKDLLLQFLEIKNSFTYDEEIFSEIFNSMKKFVEDDYETLYCFLPLYGLKGEFESLSLSEDIEIKKLSPENYSQIVDLDIAENLTKPDKKFWKLCYGVYLRLKDDERGKVKPERVYKISKKILECLRLFKSGFVQVGALYPYSTDSWNRKSLPPRIGDEIPPEYDVPLEISSSEFDEINKLYADYDQIPFEQNANSLRYLSAAIRRFDFSYEDKFSEDKITNLTMTLEFLLTRGPGEIQNKLSLRGALLLGNDEEEREYLWRLIRLCYDVRSDMVHGRQRKPNVILEKTLTDQELLKELERITRQTILAVIKLQKLGKSQKEMIAMLDISVVNRNKVFTENSNDVIETDE